jgi:hypothetical protein
MHSRNRNPKEPRLPEVSPGHAARLMNCGGENRRVAELYDVFFQLAHQNVGTPVPTSDADGPETVKRVADVLSKDA